MSIWPWPLSEEQQQFLSMLADVRDITDEQRQSVDHYAQTLGFTVQWITYNLLGAQATGWIPLRAEPLDKPSPQGYNWGSDKEQSWP